MPVNGITGSHDQIMEDTRIDLGMMELYEWDRCDKIIESQYGVMPRLQWLKLEKERIERGENRIAMVRVVHGVTCTLLVNRIAEDIEDDDG